MKKTNLRFDRYLPAEYATGCLRKKLISIKQNGLYCCSNAQSQTLLDMRALINAFIVHVTLNILVFLKGWYVFDEKNVGTHHTCCDFRD